MAQRIKIEKIDEAGKVTQTLGVNFAPISDLIFQQTEESQDFGWLKTIDPYGDTYFNHLQIPYVTQELRFLQEHSGGRFEAEINELIKFMEEIKEEVHAYCRFVGD